MTAPKRVEPVPVNAKADPIRNASLCAAFGPPFPAMYNR